MKTRWMKICRQEEGLTLLELLAALALSGLLMILVSTILSTSLLAYGRVNHETELRNQAISLSATLQTKLRNTVSVTRLDGNTTGPLTNFNAELMSDVLSGGTTHVSVKLQDKAIYLDGNRVNDTKLDLTDSYFIQTNTELQIHLTCRVTDEPNVEPLYLFVSIKFIT